MFRAMKPAVAAAAVGVAVAAAIAGLFVAIVMVAPDSAGAQSRADATGRAVTATHVTTAKMLPAVLDCSGARLVRPHGDLVLSCGDGNAMIAKTVWSSWTSKQATGTTKFYWNSCEPSCAAGSMNGYSHATVRLHDIVSTTHGKLFGEATISYRSHGKTHTLTFDLAD